MRDLLSLRRACRADYPFDSATIPLHDLSRFRFEASELNLSARMDKKLH
jgi:hypothetical protein